jgi:Xaa-Pro aminopeptidase
VDRAPVADLKSIKTDVEIEGFRQCHIRDGAALVIKASLDTLLLFSRLQAQYFSWLEQQLQAGAKISESEGADKLEHYRKYVGDVVGLASILIL